MTALCVFSDYLSCAWTLLLTSKVKETCCDQVVISRTNVLNWNLLNWSCNTKTLKLLKTINFAVLCVVSYAAVIWSSRTPGCVGMCSDYLNFLEHPAKQKYCRTAIYE